VKINMLLG